MALALGTTGRTTVRPSPKLPRPAPAVPLHYAKEFRTPCSGRGHFPATVFEVDPSKNLKGSERQDELQATTFYPGKRVGWGARLRTSWDRPHA